MVATTYRAGVWNREIASNPPQPQPWLWHGFLAPARVTLLTSLWKTGGKTTLLSLLLARRKQGGMLAGQAVQAGKTAVVSEEDVDLWSKRGQHLDFGEHVCFFCQPFDRRPTQEQWEELVDHFLELRRDHGLDLVVIDTLVSFLPLRTENHAGLMMEALQPLRRLTRAGLAVLLLHHPRKEQALAGLAARGSGALPAFVDIFVEMAQPGGGHDSRRRILNGFSRFQETPRRLLIELNAAADDYLVLANDIDDPFRANWDVILMVLEDAKSKLTRQQILAGWPTDFAKPHISTLGDWLNRGIKLHLLRCQGDGRKNNPFHYWLPGQEEKWQNDPMAKVLEAQLWVQKQIADMDRGLPLIAGAGR